MSTVRNIERRLYSRRMQDRELAARQAGLPAVAARRLEWNAVWTGYLVFVGISVLLLALVFGIGFSSVHPTQVASWAGMGKGVMIWGAIAVFIATFFGAMAASGSAHGGQINRVLSSFTFWGLVQLTLILSLGWMVGHAATAAGAALPAAASTSAQNAAAGTLQSQIQTSLQGNGIVVTADQARDIANHITAADQPGAASLLAQDANISNSRANDLLTTAVAGGASNVGRNAAQKAASGGSAVFWSVFWFALISLIVALAGGMAALGGESRLKSNARSPQAA